MPKWGPPLALVSITALLGYWVGGILPSQDFSWWGVFGGAVGAALGLIILGAWGDQFPSLKVVDFEFSVAGQKVKVAADDSKRRAAWALWIEYSSRIATKPLKEDEGLLREALTSYYSLFQLTRDVLKAAGPHAGGVGRASLLMLNECIRPTTAYWHPALKRWEESRPTKKSPAMSEKQWEHAPLLRKELGNLSAELDKWVKILECLSTSDTQVELPDPVPPKQERPPAS